MLESESPTVWEFDGDDQSNSGTYQRINAGRSEVNLNNQNEGGLRIENEDGIELWFSVDPNTNDKNGFLSWTGANTGVLGRSDSDRSDETFYYAVYNGTNNPYVDTPDLDQLVIAPNRHTLDDVNYQDDRDSNGDFTARFIGTEDKPVTVNFASGLGIWEVTFHSADGNDVIVQIGNDDRYGPDFNNGNNIDWLIAWNDETAEAVGQFTHITFKTLTPALINVKNPVFHIESLSMADYATGAASFDGSETSIDVEGGAATSEVIYDANVIDPDGDDAAARYTLTGDDADDFNIDDETGEVTFKTSPDFNAPADADNDNVYHITIIATDEEGLTTAQDLEITVTEPAAAAAPTSVTLNTI